MPPSSRRLRFAVGTSLLTASLSTGAAGCKGTTVNTAPPPEPEPVHVNEGPAEEPEAPEEPEQTVNPAPEPADPEPE